MKVVNLLNEQKPIQVDTKQQSYSKHIRAGNITNDRNLKFKERKTEKNKVEMEDKE